MVHCAMTRILMAAAEAAPYAKVGGLGDVTGALSRALAHAGHQVLLVLPKYDQIDYLTHGFQPRLHALPVSGPSGVHGCKVHHLHAATGLDVYLLEHHELFSRSGVYGDEHGPYEDNGFRFAFFSMAVLSLCHAVDFTPDVLHVHDWPTAVLPALLKYSRRDDPRFSETGSVLTIHNLAHQGISPREVLDYLGLPERAFHPSVFEDHGRVNLLKGGISQADLLSTVSPTYACEILGSVGGCGLDAHLRYRSADLHGILNGVDYDEWNPEHDPHLPATYSDENLEGKAVCKAHLQRELMLTENPRTPLLGVVARMVEQKGLDLLLDAIPAILACGAQLVVLGTGDAALETRFRELPALHPRQIGAHIGFNNRLAHMIEAGADLFVMPSRFEPCGLNQIYSLRYGTPPIVRRTGGLEDTVVDVDQDSENGTGFKFPEINAEQLCDTILRAVTLYRDQPRAWRQIVSRAMRQRFDWHGAARAYMQLYDWAVGKRQHWRWS